MLTIAALVLAAASAASVPPLVSSASWWEKITVTVAGDGKPQSCKYESSLRATSSSSCEVVSDGPTQAGGRGGPSDEYTRITFERRFIPGEEQPEDARLEPGDTLLGRHVLALAIDAAGAVQGCKVVAVSGDMTPDYGCAEVQAERFDASASREAAALRQGFMTVLIYGHSEHVV